MQDLRRYENILLTQAHIPDAGVQYLTSQPYGCVAATASGRPARPASSTAFR